jgi:hypothetical protein
LTAIVKKHKEKKYEALTPLGISGISGMEFHVHYIISGSFARLKKAGHLASDADNTNRDLLIYMLWQSGQLTHQQIGEKFGLIHRFRRLHGLL